MRNDIHPNVQILEHAVERLGSLTSEMIFVGGCASGLLLTDPAAAPVRVTQDVDVLTEVASVGDYHRLAVRLRARGFQEDRSPDAPICRWVARGVVLDVMPTDPAILGFGNRWYAPAVAAALERTLPSGAVIRMVSAPYFLATKLEAFDGRGGGDYVMSHDIEDLVAVLDGRPELVEEVQRASHDLRSYLAARFAEMSRNRRFIEALPGHLPGDAGSQGRLPVLKHRIEAIAALQEQ